MMSQPIRVSVQMDAESFRKFAVFDLLRHRKGWQRPALFMAILLVFAGVCLSQVGAREGAGLLAGVLALVGVGLPAAYFGSFFQNLRSQIKKMGLPRPFYRLELDDQGISVWMAGEQDKAEPGRRYAWQDLHLAYRTQDAIYLYVHKTQAYLLNDALDSTWELLHTVLPEARLRDLRHTKE